VNWREPLKQREAQSPWTPRLPSLLLDPGPGGESPAWVRGVPRFRGDGARLPGRSRPQACEPGDSGHARIGRDGGRHRRALGGTEHGGQADSHLVLDDKQGSCSQGADLGGGGISATVGVVFCSRSSAAPPCERQGKRHAAYRFLANSEATAAAAKHNRTATGKVRPAVIIAPCTPGKSTLCPVAWKAKLSKTANRVLGSARIVPTNRRLRGASADATIAAAGINSQPNHPTSMGNANRRTKYAAMFPPIRIANPLHTAHAMVRHPPSICDPHSTQSLTMAPRRPAKNRPAWDRERKCSQLGQDLLAHRRSGLNMSPGGAQGPGVNGGHGSTQEGINEASPSGR
jgi:hypothetical protein